MGPGVLSRRGMLAAGSGLALGMTPVAGLAATAEVAEPPRRMVSASQHGVVGDGTTDDTAALQRALDAAFSEAGGFLVIPPGAYKITRSLRVTVNTNVGHRWGIMAHGARLLSAIEDRSNVLEVVCHAYARFLLLEGLDILGTGREGHGIYLECEHKDKALYNFCLRDVVVQSCGGDGCRLIGNVFEGQIVNGYFRKNKGNGATFGHGVRAGILSAIHVFACIFGDNGHHGATLVNGCYDVSFHGCYLLLNGLFGLAAENGCTLLSNCGFENNHEQANGFARGDAGIWLQNFGALIGCTAYSVFNQKALIRAYVVSDLVMVGCTGFGGGRAQGAGLAKLSGKRGASATLVGCNGTVDYLNGFDGIEVGGDGGGVRFGADWQSPNLPRLGEYRLWVDKSGRLRLKQGAPAADDDGTLVGH
ncbi:MAG TPA: glycosyl hydrolase family 28-related protein [Alphaproteobacteria bacterium]|nr:glycosyl hydrolase family 28-related protein [Alphaproteobacteria bacterium]